MDVILCSLFQKSHGVVAPESTSRPGKIERKYRKKDTGRDELSIECC